MKFNNSGKEAVSLVSFVRVGWAACGGLLEGSDSGTISSPSFPLPYAPGVECVWTVVVSQFNMIRFTASSLPRVNCSELDSDYVTVSRRRADGAHQWSAAAQRRRVGRSRVERSDPGRSATRACVLGQNASPLIARVFSGRTLKNAGLPPSSCLRQGK